MTALAASAFVAALLGSAHCAAMCGAMACAAGDVSADPAARLRAGSAYHAARLAAYLLLGVVAGAAGAGVDSAFALQGVMRPAALIAGALLMAWGALRALEFAGVRVPRLATRTAPIGIAHSLISSVLRGVAHRRPTARAALLGAVAPLLPCGWLYAFVASAASTGSPYDGAVLMAAFWAGTVPALAAVTLGLHRLLGPARRYVPLVTAVALFAVGSLTVVRALQAGPAPRHSHVAAPINSRTGR